RRLRRPRRAGAAQLAARPRHDGLHALAGRISAIGRILRQAVPVYGRGRGWLYVAGGAGALDERGLGLLLRPGADPHLVAVAAPGRRAGLVQQPFRDRDQRGGFGRVGGLPHDVADRGAARRDPDHPVPLKGSPSPLGRGSWRGAQARNLWSAAASRRCRVSGFFASSRLRAISFLLVKESLSQAAADFLSRASTPARSGGGSTVRGAVSSSSSTVTVSPCSTPAASWIDFSTPRQ